MGYTVGHRVLWVWTPPELIALVAVFSLLAASVVGTPPLFAAELSSVSRLARGAALAFIAIELLIPLWVYIDLHRHHESTDSLWVHVAAMPGLNLVGFVAYLQERKRFRSE